MTIEKNMEEIEEKKKHLLDVKNEKRVIKKYIENLEEKMENSGTDDSSADESEENPSSQEDAEELNELRGRLQQLNENKDLLLNECKNVLLNLMREIVESKNSTRNANGKSDEEMLNRMWECFIAAILKQQDDLDDIIHVGAANDKGLADILVGKQADEREFGKFAVNCVVQVKTTKQFSVGNPSVASASILQLIGSCVYHGTRKGALYSSERKSSLMEIIQDLLETLHAQDYTIQCFFREDIESLLPKDPDDVDTFLVNFRDYLHN